MKGLRLLIKKIVKKARSYFFLAPNAAIEKRRELFAEYHLLVKSGVRLNKYTIHFMVIMLLNNV